MLGERLYTLWQLIKAATKPGEAPYYITRPSNRSTNVVAEISVFIPISTKPLKRRKTENIYVGTSPKPKLSKASPAVAPRTQVHLAARRRDCRSQAATSAVWADVRSATMASRSGPVPPWACAPDAGVWTRAAIRSTCLDACVANRVRTYLFKRDFSD